MKLLFKILKKFIWFIIFIVVAVLAVYAVYLGIIKFEFSDNVKYTNIKYSSENKDICMIFTDNGYELNDCNGNSSGLGIDSSNNCKLNYSRGYNSFIFDCGLKNINLVKMEEFDFNKIIFKYKKKNYTLINTSTFTTMDGLQKITFNFVDKDNIKFSKYLDNNLVDEETCHYTYSTNSMGLECQRFYGYSSFIIDSYDNNEVNIVIRGSKTKFVLEN